MILILSLLLAAALIGIWYTRPFPGGRVCHVMYEREDVMTLPLDTDGVFTFEQHRNIVFEVRDGRVAFIASDCPDQICVHTGFIGEPGQLAACLPNRTSIRIDANGAINAPDAVVR